MKKNPFLKVWAFICLGLFFAISCGEDDPVVEPDAPIASFQFDISETNFLEVAFSNFSRNASSYTWDFGDGNSSTDENPTHTYASAGDYTVTLTATGAGGTDDISNSFTLVDPNEALKRLTGETSKTWKLFREGTCLSLGPNADNPAGWWSGLSNNGARPCLYSQTFTFHLDGTFVFDDMGMFWGENDPWGGTDLHETCFESSPANMVNKDGADVSAWGSGTHAFEYDPAAGQITLNGMGAWMGLVQTVGLPDLYSNVPTATRTFNAEIREEVGYDVLTITYDYGEGGIWTCVYASYSDPSLEPGIETEEQEFGEDLEDISPDVLSFSFASDDDFTLLSPIESVSQIATGVDDPADASAAKVGQFTRTTDLYQELKFQTAPDPKDINFENLTSVSLDVYLPSSNDYSGELSTVVIIGFADQSKTEQWWTDNREFSIADGELELDTWHPLTFQLDSPNAGAGSYSLYERTDLDMIYIHIGGGGHAVPGTFYVRNFRFE